MSDTPTAGETPDPIGPDIDPGPSQAPYPEIPSDPSPSEAPVNPGFPDDGRTYAGPIATS